MYFVYAKVQARPLSACTCINGFGKHVYLVFVTLYILRLLARKHAIKKCPFMYFIIKTDGTKDLSLQLLTYWTDESLLSPLHIQPFHEIHSTKSPVSHSF